MATDTERDGAEARDESMDEMAYWRRRALVLGGALGTAGLLAWGCAAGGDDRPARNAGAPASVPASAQAPGQPAGQAIPTAIPTITVTATAKVTVTPVAPRKDGDACEPRDLVVSLAATQDTYAGRDLPEFRLSVVNLGQRACTYDVGPKALQTRITSGSDKIWSSASCVAGDGSRIQMLRRGIPYLATVTWDRKRTSSRCDGRRATAGTGTYVAVIKAPGVSTKKQVFRLR